jgi:hypothetical protein
MPKLFILIYIFILFYVMDEATRSNQLSLIVETFCLEKKVTLYEDGLYKELFKRWPLY